jgi:hypothetical protein
MRPATSVLIGKAGEPVSVRDELEPLRSHCCGGQLGRRRSEYRNTRNKNEQQEVVQFHKRVGYTQNSWRSYC